MVDFGLPNATMHKVGESAAVEDIHALSRIYERIVRKVDLMVKFSLNPRRFDPYKNFKFRLVGFAALGPSRACC